MENESKNKEHGTTFLSKMHSVFSRFSERTSMHGCGYIKTSRHFLTKLFWVLVTSIAIVVLVLHLYMIFTQFLRRPINTKVSLGFSNLRFPALTVCNINVMRNSAIKEHASPELVELITTVNPENIISLLAVDLLSTNDKIGVDVTNMTYHEIVEGLYRGNNALNISMEYDIFTSDNENAADDWTTERSFESFTWVLFRFLYMQLSREKRRASGHHLADMLLSCTFNDKMCYGRNFTLYQTATYGNCYTLDSDRLVASKPGKDGGLSLTLYLQTDEFVQGITNGHGAKVIVHEPGTKALPDQEGIFVSANTETSIGLKKTTVEHLGSPYGECRDGSGFKQQYGMGYNVKICTQTCFANYIWERCQCWYFMHELVALSSKKTFNMCNTEKEMVCMTKALIKYNRKEIECDCKNACSAVYYTQSVSSRQWPSEVYAKLLKEIVCLSRFSKCKKSFLRERDIEKNFVRLNIFYETLNFESVEEEPLIDIFTFLSSIGGAFGLWIGLSMLSLCEVLQLGIEIVTCVAYKCIGRTGVKDR